MGWVTTCSESTLHVWVTKRKVCKILYVCNCLTFPLLKYYMILLEIFHSYVC